MCVCTAAGIPSLSKALCHSVSKPFDPGSHVTLALPVVAARGILVVFIHTHPPTLSSGPPRLFVQFSLRWLRLFLRFHDLFAIPLFVPSSATGHRFLKTDREGPPRLFTSIHSFHTGGFRFKINFQLSFWSFVRSAAVHFHFSFLFYLVWPSFHVMCSSD